MEVIDSYEHAGLLVEFVQDGEGWSADPQDHDNAGRILSWTRDFSGDESIRQPDVVSGKPYELADADDPNDLSSYFSEYYDAVLTLPLRFEDYGSSGARIHITDADCANAVIVFTQEDLDEWSGSVDDATKYAQSRIGELDKWLQGYVLGIVIREREDGPMLESVWGFIADPYDKKDREWLDSEANGIADYERMRQDEEAAEAHHWACADVMTV